MVEECMFQRKTDNVPRNKKQGDCGVFTLKYIEFLALGTSFDGLSDETILDIQHKYATNIFAEFPESSNGTISHPPPIPNQDIIITSRLLYEFD
ncbi:unnamed protein product [Cochlearia groenlandica]